MQHESPPGKPDPRLHYYVGALLSLIDWHLKIWAGFVGLGQEVDGPGPRQDDPVPAFADFWLITEYLGDDAYKQWLAGVMRNQIACHYNRYPELQPRLLEGVLQALTSPTLLRVMARMRYEAVDRIIVRWEVWPFDKRVLTIHMAEQYLTATERRLEGLLPRVGARSGRGAQDCGVP